MLACFTRLKDDTLETSPLAARIAAMRVLSATELTTRHHYPSQSTFSMAVGLAARKESTRDNLARLE